MGSLYQRGQLWWIKYYANGRPVRESAGTTKETEARRVLKEREGKVAMGQSVLKRVDRVRYEEIAADLRTHYRITGSRDLDEVEGRLKHLDKFFKGWKVVAIDADALTEFIVARQGEGAANSTINRDLAVLHKMLSLAYEHNKLVRPPLIHRLKEPPPRRGFFEREQFEAIKQHLPPDLQVAVMIAYTYGWRMQSEVLTLERRQADLDAGTLRLEPGTTKNDDGRVVYLTPVVRTMLIQQLDRVRELEHRLGRIISYVFPHLQGRYCGTRRRDFRKAWELACQRAGCPGMYRHDFRRTAVRNMVNAGVREKVAMQVTGHKTREVFDRYHIVSPADLQEAARRMAGTIPGTVGEIPLDPQSVTQ